MVLTVASLLTYEPELPAIGMDPSEKFFDFRRHVRSIAQVKVFDLKTAIQHGVSSKSYWHMARTPAVQQALSNAWLKAQGLLSVKDLWCKAQGYTARASSSEPTC